MNDTHNTQTAEGAPDEAEVFKSMANMVINGAFVGSACAELLATGRNDEALAACEGSAQTLALYVQLATEMQDQVRVGSSLMQAVEVLVMDGWPYRLGWSLGAGLH